MLPESSMISSTLVWPDDACAGRATAHAKAETMMNKEKIRGSINPSRRGRRIFLPLPLSALVEIERYDSITTMRMHRRRCGNRVIVVAPLRGKALARAETRSLERLAVLFGFFGRHSEAGFFVIGRASVGSGQRLFLRRVVALLDAGSPIAACAGQRSFLIALGAARAMRADYFDRDLLKIFDSLAMPLDRTIDFLPL